MINTINKYNYNILIFLISIFIIYKIVNNYIFKGLIYFLFNNIKVCNIIDYLYVYNEIFINKSYDLLPIKDNMIICDVGANIGLYNLYMNSKAKNLKIFSFEPVPQIYKNLKHNISTSINNNNNNILINKGLGEVEKNINMNYVKNVSAMSSINNYDKTKLDAHDNIYENQGGIFSKIIKKYIEKQLNNPEIVNISITTLSNIIKQYNIKKIDILKIDVEGYEYNVLKGINKNDFNIINNIIVEIENFRNNNKKNIINILKNNNYKIKITSVDNKSNWLNVYAYK